MTEEPEIVTPEPVSVKVIGAKGPSSLVEWWVDGVPNRAYAPAKAIKDGKIAADTLAKCPPYGIQWAGYLKMDGITAQAISDELRKAGIWTLDDLKQRDRVLLQIATKLIGTIVWDAAKRAAPKEK